MREWGCDTLNRKLLGRFGSTVREGPFAGLVLPEMASAEHLGPFLLGVYESELDSAWQTVLRGRYSQIADVGASFGFYAVGLARRYPASPVVAFDADRWARTAVRETALVNGVTNVEIRAFCSRRWLQRRLLPGAFVLSDCEGYESVLFAGPIVRSLESATLLIETHEAAAPGVGETLRTAFDRTHEVRVVSAASGRRRSSHPLEFLSENERDLANHEIRGPQTWLLCLPRANDTFPTAP